MADLSDRFALLNELNVSEWEHKSSRQLVWKN